MHVTQNNNVATNGGKLVVGKFGELSVKPPLAN